MKQQTIKNTIEFNGIGLHSGLNVNVRLKPGLENTGIVFKRIDIPSKNNEIPALYNYVSNTNLGTLIKNSNNFSVSTIEHFMASVWACDIDNLIIELDNIELPIMDGSALKFIELLEKSSIQKQNSNRKILKILKEISIINEDKNIIILPDENFSINLNVEFNYGNIGKQNIQYDGDKTFFKKNLSQARTFCNEKEIEFMKQNKLALGGSLENAMVFNENNLINKDGFRLNNEVVSHKLLDCIGDMFTSGYNIKGKIIGNKTGHTLHNMLLRKIFAENDNYKILE